MLIAVAVCSLDDGTLASLWISRRLMRKRSSWITVMYLSIGNLLSNILAMLRKKMALDPDERRCSSTIHVYGGLDPERQV